ncbi:putative two-component histidine kinase [Flavihumibacter petaseus NBRC 106054]|uniref:histidine kinase n=2 Tax=Flavihumibacter TaxID=1004301 RepID=A0A0E9N780_9BACT|nr:putative two-component histidine kinase [Flavihumibacter petaseus NBRC 106054]
MVLSGISQPHGSPADTICLSRFQLYLPIGREARIYFDTANLVKTDSLYALPGSQPLPSSADRKVAARYVSKACYLQFVVKNDLDRQTEVDFLPGFYFNTINLFRRHPETGKYEPVTSAITQKTFNSHTVRKLSLRPGETGNYIAELGFIKTTVNTITPCLTYGFYLPTLLSQFQNEKKLNAIITYLVCGIMLMMIFYSLAGFYMNRSIEFIYYAAYAFMLGLMFFFKAYLYKTPTDSNFFFESYFDFVLQGTGTLFYFIFLRTFIGSKTEFPLLNIILYAQQVITVSGLILFTYLNFFTNNFPLQNLVENLIKYAWSFSTIFFIIYAVVNRSYILRYLAIGHTFLFLGGFLSLFLINTARRFNDQLTALSNDSLFWYEMGILFELVFFLVALSFKNKKDISDRAREKERLLMDYEKEAYERRMAILAAKQDERNRISADMHDELGSGVTAIRLMSELAKTKLKEHALPEIEKISVSANDLISKMNTIIWTMKSTNDTVDNMIAYVRSYAAEFLENTDIRWRIEYPENVAGIELTGEKRRNIFLCIKEALNNIAKHARASEVLIQFKLGPHLVILIKDNGVGMQPDKIRAFSNGLSNMRKRMETVDGHFGIRSESGTVVTLSVPLA